MDTDDSILGARKREMVKPIEKNHMLSKRTNTQIIISYSICYNSNKTNKQPN